MSTRQVAIAVMMCLLLAFAMLALTGLAYCQGCGCGQCPGPRAGVNAGYFAPPVPYSLPQTYQYAPAPAGYGAPSFEIDVRTGRRRGVNVDVFPGPAYPQVRQYEMRCGPNGCYYLSR